MAIANRNEILLAGSYKLIYYWRITPNYGDWIKLFIFDWRISKNIQLLGDFPGDHRNWIGQYCASEFSPILKFPRFGLGDSFTLDLLCV